MTTICRSSDLRCRISPSSQYVCFVLAGEYKYKSSSKKTRQKPASAERTCSGSTAQYATAVRMKHPTTWTYKALTTNISATITKIRTKSCCAQAFVISLSQDLPKMFDMLTTCEKSKVMSRKNWMWAHFPSVCRRCWTFVKVANNYISFSCSHDVQSIEDICQHVKNPM